MNFEATGKILNIWIYPDSGERPLPKDLKKATER
jgi:hypothetical protein